MSTWNSIPQKGILKDQVLDKDIFKYTKIESLPLADPQWKLYNGNKKEFQKEVLRGKKKWYG